MKFLTKQEEDQIKQILINLAGKHNLLSRSEIYERSKSLYIDHLWWIKIDGDKIPIVAFEIEKGIPYNERIRKDILNLVMSKAPRGCIILPHERIKGAFNPDKYQPWVDWYYKNFSRVFQNYYKPFTEFIEIRLVDADENNRLKPIVF